MQQAKTIEEYFGTLQQSYVETWREHLKTSKKSVHETLNDLYDELAETVDTLIENYMGVHGKIKEYKNLLPDEDMEPLVFCEELREFVIEGRDELIDEDDTEIWSCVDDVLSALDTAIYKLRDLEPKNECLDLRSYLLESLVCEAVSVPTGKWEESPLLDKIERIKYDTPYHKSLYQGSVDKLIKFTQKLDHDEVEGFPVYKERFSARSSKSGARIKTWSECDLTPKQQIVAKSLISLVLNLGLDVEDFESGNATKELEKALKFPKKSGKRELRVRALSVDGYNNLILSLYSFCPQYDDNDMFNGCDGEIEIMFELKK